VNEQYYGQVKTLWPGGGMKSVRYVSFFQRLMFPIKHAQTFICC